MPTVKAELRVDKAKTGKQLIYVVARNKSDRLRVPTGFKVEEKYWSNGRVNAKHPDSKIINAKIQQIISTIENYYAECALRGRPIILENALRGTTSMSFNDYLKMRIAQYDENGAFILRRKTNGILGEIETVLGTVLPGDINGNSVRQIDNYLIKIGNNPTTRKKKIKRMGELLGAMIKEGYAEGSNAFKEYNITAKPAKKDRLTFEQIEKIEQLQLKPGPIDLARDVFLFSYYVKGIRFGDVATVKTSDIIGDRVRVSSTQKDGDFITVRIHSRLKKIIDKYYDKDRQTLFPLFNEIPEDYFVRYSKLGSLNAVINKNLKIVAALAEININLTMHTARHTFAQHMRVKSGSLEVIQQALGHSDMRTTRIYLKSLDDSAIDPDINLLYGD